jgi:MFS family permease
MLFGSAGFVPLLILYPITLDYPENYQLMCLVPAAVILGFGMSVLWCSQSSYLVKCSDGKNIGYLNGLFYLLLGLNSIFGNLGTAALFAMKVQETIIFAVLALIGVMGVAMFAFLGARDPAPSKTEFSLRPVIQAVAYKPLRHIMLFYCYTGILMGYLGGSLPLFIESTDSEGMGLKLYLLTAFGVGTSFSSPLFGSLIDKHGSGVVYFSGAVLQAATFILLTLTYPVNNLYILFPCFLILGLVDAMLNTSQNAMMGKYCSGNLECSYAISRFCQSTCACIIFVSSQFFLKGRLPNMDRWIILLLLAIIINSISIVFLLRQEPPVIPTETIDSPSRSMAIDDNNNVYHLLKNPSKTSLERSTSF